MKKLLHLLVLLGMISSAALMAGDSCASQAADKAQVDEDSGNFDDEDEDAEAEAAESQSE